MRSCGSERVRKRCAGELGKTARGSRLTDSLHWLNECHNNAIRAGLTLRFVFGNPAKRADRCDDGAVVQGAHKALSGRDCSEMAYKVARSEAPRLFAFIKRLQFSFDPFATESTAVREAWRQLTSPTLRAANPKCKVDVISARGVAPAMEAEFVDGAKRPINASGAAANLVGELYRTAHSISLDYALKGKPPPT